MAYVREEDVEVLRAEVIVEDEPLSTSDATRVIGEWDRASVEYYELGAPEGPWTPDDSGGVFGMAEDYDGPAWNG